MIKKLFMVITIFLFSISIIAKDPNSDLKLVKVNEIIEVIGNVPSKSSIQSISVITKDDMRQFMFNNLKSLLSLTPGVLTLSNGGFGQSSSTFIRGANSTQVLYLIDGIKIRDVSNIGGVNLSTISPFLINKVEIVRGPLSSFYGSDAMGGVINIVSGSEEGINIETSLGSYGSYQGNISWSAKKGDLNFSIASANRFFTDNIKNDKFRNNGISAKIDYKKEGNLNAGFRFFGNLTNSGIPTNFQTPSPERKYKQMMYSFGVPLGFNIGSETRVKLNISYNKNYYRFEDKNDLWNPYYKNTSDNHEIEAIITRKLSNSIELSAGSDYSGQNIFSENNFGTTIDNVKSNYFSTFLRGKYETGNLFLSGSVRYDKYKDVDSNISPQIGLSYIIGGKVKIRGSYAESFRAPLPVHQINPWGESNFELIPEKARSFETGIEFFAKDLIAGLTYFSTKYANLIDWVTIDLTTWKGQYQNVNRANIDGIEFEINYLPFKHFKFSLSHTYLKTEDLSSGNPLPRRPKNTSALSFVYNGRSFSISGRMRYVGKRNDFDFTSYPPDVKNPPFNTYDLTIQIPFRSKISFFFKMTNLFNTDYQEFFGYPSPGRRFETGIKYVK